MEMRVSGLRISGFHLSVDDVVLFASLGHNVYGSDSLLSVKQLDGE